MRSQGFRIPKPEFRRFMSTDHLQTLDSKISLKLAQRVCSDQRASTGCVRHGALAKDWIDPLGFYCIRALAVIDKSLSEKISFADSSVGLPETGSFLVQPLDPSSILNSFHTSSTNRASRPMSSETWTSC